MSLDITKLKKVRHIHGGGVKAQCPACAEAGGDRAGDHLFIKPDGKFGCAVAQGDKQHRARIFALVGGATPKDMPRPAQTSPRPAVDCAAIMAGLRSAQKSGWIDAYADLLGVSVESLNAFGVAWHAGRAAWAWPMSDAAGKIIGIRLRPNVGKKFCVTGSVTGIFLPQMIPPRRLTICEGGTDAASAMTLGLLPIGRPSCMGGVEIILDYIRRNRVREVVIVADNDPKVRPDGTPWNPGMEGAEILQRQLTVPSVLLTMPAKDLRAAVNAGMTRAVYDCLLSGQIWQQPKRR